MVVWVLLAYASLFIWSFLPATLLPLGSELALIALVLVATVGNFLGSCTIYRLARRAARVLVSPQATELGRTRAAHLVRRWGHPALLLSWVPLLGDGLVAFAGACPCPSVPSPSGCSLQGPAHIVPCNTGAGAIQSLVRLVRTCAAFLMPTRLADRQPTATQNFESHPTGATRLSTMVKHRILILGGHTLAPDSSVHAMRGQSCGR